MGKQKNKTAEVGFYSLGEEIANSTIHGIGALLSVAAMVVIIVLSIIDGGGVYTLAAVLYGTALVVLYCMSTLYHAVTHKTAKRMLRICDHCSIFLLIAGTYSPLMLITLKGIHGTILFATIWSVTVFGIVLNAIDLKRFEKLSLVLYVLMGWAVLVAIKPLYAALPPAGFWLVVGGGVVYTLGLIFYGCKWKFAHSVWHLFVLGASVLHFLAILLYVY
jgi:hemolysin III